MYIMQKKRVPLSGTGYFFLTHLGSQPDSLCFPLGFSPLLSSLSPAPSLGSPPAVLCFPSLCSTAPPCLMLLVLYDYIKH